MEDTYPAIKDGSFLIHAQEPPHASQNRKESVVDLNPVGQPVFLLCTLTTGLNLPNITCNDWHLICHGWICSHALPRSVFTL